MKLKIILTFCIIVISALSYAQNNDKANDSIVLEKGKLTDGITIKEIKSKKNDVSINDPIITRPPTFETCKSFNAIEEQKDCFTQTLQKFISKKFNISALTILPEGRHKIHCFFTISKKGEITNIDIYSNYKIAETEAEKLVSEIPKLEPGEVNNEPSDISYWLPITFMLQ
ncbi:hypothetical protein JBL43_12690 [Aureibaculum sp. A20]|uniref:TonB C-terminal domain-containing protein n=1 Tax=Aureibaculum flavum TaxID=2795986 RepID=A0ABS0WT21_9FLAO|nr:hypothetical protein [Aureibaculum flavum]MBJ2175102.1 hypothetical protein [Aureibaculum flavum]